MTNNTVNQRIENELFDNQAEGFFDTLLADAIYLINQLRLNGVMVTVIYDPQEESGEVYCHLECYQTWTGKGRNLQTAVCDAVIKYLDDKGSRVKRP